MFTSLDAAEETGSLLTGSYVSGSRQTSCLFGR